MVSGMQHWVSVRSGPEVWGHAGLVGMGRLEHPDIKILWCRDSLQFRPRAGWRMERQGQTLPKASCHLNRRECQTLTSLDSCLPNPNPPRSPGGWGSLYGDVKERAPGLLTAHRLQRAVKPLKRGWEGITCHLFTFTSFLTKRNSSHQKWFYNSVRCSLLTSSLLQKDVLWKCKGVRFYPN